MSVQIVWSTELGGNSIAEPLNHGDNIATSITDPQTIFIRHTGSNPITSCSFYTRQWATTYLGDFSSTSDFNEIVEWGDATTSGLFGGLQFNLDANASFPDYNWPDVDNKTTASGQGFVASSGVAISLATAFDLPLEMGLTVSGQIDVGTPDVSFQARFQVPTLETTAGIRLIEQVLNFTFTS